MNPIDTEVLHRLAEWQRNGVPATLVTVTHTWGTSPRPVGAMMVVSHEGQFCGSVSGGCIEDGLIERLKSAPPALPEKANYGVSSEQAARHGLPCGGRLELVIESVQGGDWAARIEDALATREFFTRRLELATGATSLEQGTDTDVVMCDEQQLVMPFAPPWRMIIIGAGHLSAHTARLGVQLGYEVTVCEPRALYRDAWEEHGIAVTSIMPDDLIEQMQPDGRTVVLALTHDPKLDDLAMLEALGSDAYYVGALGSSRTNAARRKRLKQHFDISDEHLSRLHGPVGIDLGTRRAPEIALSILAEITALRNGVQLTGTRMEG